MSETEKPRRIRPGLYRYRGWKIQRLSHRHGMHTTWRLGNDRSNLFFPTLKDAAAAVDSFKAGA